MPLQPADALSSPLATVVFSQLRESADWVFVSAAPVLAGSEAGAAARLGDGVLMVLAAGVTRRDDATKAREVLDRVGARVLGSVLTGVSVAEAGFAHYQGR
jgi:Mrp family chromosome partitioning ATPase